MMSCSTDRSLRFCASHSEFIHWQRAQVQITGGKNYCCCRPVRPLGCWVVISGEDRGKLVCSRRENLRPAALRFATRVPTAVRKDFFFAYPDLTVWATKCR